MIFHKREKDDSIDTVKDAISKPPEDDLPFITGGPPYEEAREEPIEYPVEPPAVRGGRDAPLFVKVEKYGDVLSLIQEMKVFISGVKQLFDILEDLESLRIDAIKMMKATIHRVERRLVEMDNELLRPKGFQAPSMPHTEPEMQHVEDTMTDLQNELSKLRNELEGLK